MRGLDAAGREEAIIRQLGGMLVARGVIDDDYIERAIERERLSSTAFTDALAVPLAAVELAGDGDFVSVVRAGETARVPVSLGLRGDDGYVEVSGDLSEGDRVVLPVR